jgi:hypothetical protein
VAEIYPKLGGNVPDKIGLKTVEVCQWSLSFYPYEIAHCVYHVHELKKVKNQAADLERYKLALTSPDNNQKDENTTLIKVSVRVIYHPLLLSHVSFSHRKFATSLLLCRVI